MAKLAKVNLWGERYTPAPISPLKATAKRKLFTSLLVALLMVTAGTAFYIYTLQVSRSGSIKETPRTRPGRKSFPQRLAILKSRTAFSIKNLLTLPGFREIYIDGDNNATLLFSASTHDDLIAIKSQLNGFFRTPRLADTLRLRDTLFAVFTCLLPPSEEPRTEPVSVEPYGRVIVMSNIDSLSTVLGISVVSKDNIGTYEFQETLLVDEKATELEQITAFRFAISGLGQRQAWAELIRRSLEFNEAIILAGAQFSPDDTSGLSYGKVSWDIFQIARLIQSADSSISQK